MQIWILILIFMAMICADLLKFWLYQVKSFVCYNIVYTIDGTEAFCMVLKRITYWHWYSDLIRWCDRSVPELCLMLKAILILMPCIQKEQSLGNCFGFMDGVVWPMYKPANNQIILFYGNKRIHALKFQSCSNGLLQIFMLQLKGKDIIVLS